MIATRHELITAIHNKWPYLKDGLPGPTNIAMADMRYWIPSIQSIEFFLKNTNIDRFDYHSEGFDCDDFAYVLAGFARQHRYYEMKVRGLFPQEWLQWPFGMCWGTKFEGRKTGHAINIVIARDDKDKQDLYLIEPQNDKIWIANQDDDKPHFICM